MATQQDSISVLIAIKELVHEGALSPLDGLKMFCAEIDCSLTAAIHLGVLDALKRLAPVKPS